MEKDEFIKKARVVGIPEVEIKQYLKDDEEAIKKIGISMLETRLKVYYNPANDDTEDGYLSIPA